MDVTYRGSQLNYVDLHYLGVHDGEEIAEGRDAALVDEVADLVGRAARAGVGDRPGRLLSRAVKRECNDILQNFLGEAVKSQGEILLCPLYLLPERRNAEDPDEHREDVGVDHSLDLLAVARSDVADGPARLLPHALLDRAPAQ